MPVLCIIPSSLRLRKPPRRLMLAVVLVFVTSCAWAKGPDPSQTIPLAPLGFQPLSSQFLLAGSSMETVDFVDARHLLVTYSTKRLLRRLPDCPPGDQDRVIEAVLLEIPSGKLLARTEWRVHDRGQYLWNLGHGRFLLRIRDALATFAPVANLSKGNAFYEKGFIRTDRRIGGLILSPDADLLIVETLEPLKGDAPIEEAKQDETPVQINFFRLTPQGEDEIGIVPTGALRARAPGRIPANAAGFLSAVDQGRQHWGFSFQSFSGKVKELAAFDSTCRPSAMLVSRSEFVAFGCHATSTPQIIGGFNLRGEEMWEQSMTESYVSPMFVFASGAGRFALSRVLTHSAAVDADAFTQEQFDGQAITVYQTDSGRQLLRVDATPISRAGQNFALSPDGLRLAVLQNDTVAIYGLPALTSKEREAVQMAEAAAPQIDGDPALALREKGTGAMTAPTADVLPSGMEAAPGASSVNQGPIAPAADAAPASNSQGSGQTVGDAPPEQRRKRPTLYNPGEKREDGSHAPE